MNAPTTSNSSGDSGPDAASPAWRTRLRSVTLDTVYRVATLLIIPLYVISTSFRSEIFIFYAVLFVLRVRSHGYRRTGLEWVTLAAVLGLAASYAGEWHSGILKNVLQVARIITLPLLMSQYRSASRPERAFACIFTGLAVYGVVRMLFFPLVTGYAQDRPYCFSDFFMHSSLIAVSGYLFSLVVLMRRPEWRWKAIGAVVAAAFLYLVAVHQVRASYLSVLLVTPLLLIAELRGVRRLHWLAACLLLAAAIALPCVLRPAAVRTAVDRAMTITDPGEGSNRGRLVIWSRALGVFREHPINGIGYRRLNRNYHKLGNERFEWSFAHAHNEILGLLAETGLIGAVAWLVFKLRLLLLLFRDRRQDFSAFLLYLLIAFEVHNVFEYYLYERTAYIYVFLLVGLGLNALLNRREQAVREAV